jgi:hypothetical protein
VQDASAAGLGCAWGEGYVSRKLHDRNTSYNTARLHTRHELHTYPEMASANPYETARIEQDIIDPDDCVSPPIPPRARQ